jgi:hypothetical protein
MKWEIKKLFRIKGKFTHYYPTGFRFWEKLWWSFVPGVVVKVRWPKGKIVVDHTDPRWVDLGGAVCVELESADPNDFFRPWLEENVGRQGWDWNWGFVGNDVSDNCLTIKVRQKYARYATIMLLRWA